MVWTLGSPIAGEYKIVWINNTVFFNTLSYIQGTSSNNVPIQASVDVPQRFCPVETIFKATIVNNTGLFNNVMGSIQVNDFANGGQIYIYNDLLGDDFPATGNVGFQAVNISWNII